MAVIRTMWFFLVLALASLVLCTIWLAIAPVTILTFDRDRHIGHAMSTLWARIIIGSQPWWHVRVDGRERLAPPGEAVVYVANHRHEADILVLFLLRTRFRWLSKRSVFRVPLIGWSMYATGYVGVVRGSHASHAASKRHSLRLLERGVPMLFFPEGTFGQGKELAFKQGAFRLAQQAGVPVQPIVTRGTDHLFRGKTVLPARVEIRILDRIETRDRTAAEVSEACRDVMAAALHELRRESRHERGSGGSDA